MNSARASHHKQEQRLRQQHQALQQQVRCCGGHDPGAYQSSQGNSGENDPNNTTVFVGGLNSNVNEDYLRQMFTPYGEISYVKIPVGKHCGFVQFTSRSCAEEAIQMLNGSQIGGQKVRLSWNHTQNKQASQQDASSQYNGNNYYGYQQQGYIKGGHRKRRRGVAAAEESRSTHGSGRGISISSGSAVRA